MRNAVCLIVFFLAGFLFAQPVADSLQIDNLLKQTWELRYSEPHQAQKKLDSAENIALKTEDTDRLAKIHYYRAVIYFLTGENITCISFAEKALNLYKNEKNEYGQTSVYNLLGLVNQNLGIYEKAIGYYHESLIIAEKGDNLYAISNPLHNISIVYQKIKDYKQSLKYAKKALEIRQKIGNKDFIAESYLFVGGIYHLMGEFDESEKNLLTAQKLFTELNNHPVGLGLTYNNLGMLYKDKGELKKAEDLFKKALTLQKNQEGRYEDIINTLYNLSYVAIANKDYLTAKKYASEANHIANQQNLLPGKRNALEALSDALEGLKDYEKAFFVNKELLYVSDSLLNEEKSKQILNLEVKYQTVQKDKTIAEQALVLSEKDRKLAQRKMWLIFIGSFAILSLIIFYVIQNKKRVRLQKEEEQKINSAIFESEQKERIRIARDLHDSIGQKLSVIKMLLPKANGDENLRKITDFLNETTAEVRSISHNLIPEILNFGLIKAISETADKINSTENIVVKIKTDENTQNLKFSKQTEVSLYRIVQEILGNIIKHSQAHEILIDIKKVSEFVQINIKDNGVGFDTNTIDQSEGLGWKNIFARIKLINGDIKVRSEKNKGSDFLLKIPIL